VDGGSYSQLFALINAGCSAACAAIALNRSISVVQNKARRLGKPTQMALPRVGDFPRSSNRQKNEVMRTFCLICKMAFRFG
jgi:hypothetical protein